MFFLIKDFLFSKICFVSPWNLGFETFVAKIDLATYFVALFWGFLIRNPRDKVHISWPDADDLLSNGLEFDNEVEGPWPLGRRACLQVRLGMAGGGLPEKNGGELWRGRSGLKEKVGFLVKCFLVGGNVIYTKPCNES